MRGKFVRGLLQGALDLFLPASCAACGAVLGAEARPSPVSSRVCAGCWGAVAFLKPPFCPRCGEPFASDSALSDSPGHLCGRCRSRPPAYDAARAVGLYEGALREMIHTYKYDGQNGLAGALGGLMAESLRERFGAEGFDLITNVPLHPRRYRERGFDQAWRLALHLGRRARLPAVPYLLERTRWDVSQPGSTEAQRRANVRGAFAARRSGSAEGRRILLVDDVLTTGATADACAKALKRAGAESVHVYTLARTA